MVKIVSAIREMSNKNDQILLKLDYPTSPASTGSSFPRVLLKNVSDKYDDFILGTTIRDTEIIINPDKVVSAEPYKTRTPNITSI